MNSGLKGAVFVLPYFIVKHLSDPLEIPLASRLLGPYETSFRTFDATDYQPIGEQEGLLQIFNRNFFWRSLSVNLKYLDVYEMSEKMMLEISIAFKQLQSTLRRQYLICVPI